MNAKDLALSKEHGMAQKVIHEELPNARRFLQAVGHKLWLEGSGKLEGVVPIDSCVPIVFDDLTLEIRIKK